MNICLVYYADRDAYQRGADYLPSPQESGIEHQASFIPNHTGERFDAVVIASHEVN